MRVILMTIGMLIAGISVFADTIGLGGVNGFGLLQATGAVIGTMLFLAGLIYQDAGTHTGRIKPA